MANQNPKQLDLSLPADTFISASEAANYHYKLEPSSPSEDFEFKGEKPRKPLPITIDPIQKGAIVNLNLNF